MESSSDEEFEDASDLLLDVTEDLSARLNSLHVSQSADCTPEEDEGAGQKDDVPAPGEVTVHNIGVDSVSLSWVPLEQVLKHCFELTYSCGGPAKTMNITDSSRAKIEGLQPGREYNFSLVTIGENGRRSKSVSASAFTQPPPPKRLWIDDVSSESLSLCWEKPADMEDISFKYHVTSNQVGEESQEMTTVSNTYMFRNLAAGAKYTFRVSVVLENGSKSKCVTRSICTKTHLEGLLAGLGLEQNYKDKLTLSTVLQIDHKTITDEPADSPQSLPWCFLKRLMMVNVTARSVKCVPVSNKSLQDTSLLDDLESLVDDHDNSHVINPLDIVTALFLCSDGFLQQEMVLKMSMCQFSVPLLLPNCDSQQCTLMVWAMRDVVKKYRPHSLADPRGFVEDRIVLTDLPMVSFVRLGESTLSKSQILNKLLSNPQQYHDTFVHHDMECGDRPRKISDGLVEISWYLPCGNKNIDIFGEPVAVANLRGDISCFEMQYSFLCQTSAAVFVFFDNLDNNYRLLTNQHIKAQLFLVGNPQSKTFNMDALKRTASELNLKKGNIILKTRQMNDADFVKNLRTTVDDVVKNNPFKMQVEQMCEVAYELGILVDEDSKECQRAKQNADAITSNIGDTLQYKESQLPLQGSIWKELARLEKEECRLRKAGDQKIEDYKAELQAQKQRLREKQSSYDMTEAMTCFINAISSSGSERSYFLKWMRMNLDNLSRRSLSGLREQYKEKCQNSVENREEIANLDRQISTSSLGPEHFLREMGQLYESAFCLPENAPSRKQMLHLPRLCAELLLDGFPLELIDGDASNIPLKWVSDVLIALDDLVKPKNKILVVTVLGVQSTGKSTLLNTMFGVQFAVSSGRCTRGAFMLLIRVKENFKEDLNCDFIMIIDTEGLKSPELAQLDDSYEHDNELATLVVGLSDITIINIAMENSTEMKDILQIVVHAFLRMKEVGKKPKCQFVHQNVADVSAHDKNMRDRKMLLEQLNEMTQAAARMENKEENKNFTDVMEYDPETGNWYIPGLWHGNPPMAPVNAGYSEAVHEFRKNVIEVFQKKRSGNDIIEFLEWTKSLWRSVKFENFIFSFRNSLVADAYAKLCIEYSKWEWAFRKGMYTWVTNAETRISNFGTVAAKSQISNISDLLTILKSEASTELTKGEKTILESITRYYEQTEGHVYLVERYREDFANSAKSLRREMENSVLNKLETAVEIKQGMNSLEQIKKTYTATMEKKVLMLIESCRKNKSGKSDQELEGDYEKMWKETLDELPLKGLCRRDVKSGVFSLLRSNLQRKGSSVNEKLNKVNFDKCGMKHFVVKPDSFIRWVCNVFSDEKTKKTQELADSLTERCKQFVSQKVESGSDYHETYVRELLRLIENTLDSNKDLETTNKFEVDLKLHICANAAREFQKMHESFIQDNDPRLCVEHFKYQFRADFIDLFNERDQCQKKAEEFTNLCLRPAVKDFVATRLGPDIVDEMLTGKDAFQYSTRSFFQFSILKQLLTEFKFKKYVKYIVNYEDFVNAWILEQITERFSKGNKMFELQAAHLKMMTKKVMGAISNAERKCEETKDIKEFVHNICCDLGEMLVIPQDVLEAIMILNNANQEQFAHWLMKCVEEMEESLASEFQSESNIKKKLQSLPFKPQNELFTRVFGCGKQCPFCMAPCEAGGEAHTDHCASIHRPKALGTYRFVHSQKLVTDICSSSVFSDAKFICYQTKGKYHPYKKYREIFPDWHIPADPSIQASDYWKFVLAKFNREFAEKYSALPADIPPAWNEITKEQAENSLKESFSMK